MTNEKLHTRIADPIRRVEDFVGDTTVRTGVTSGSSHPTSATRDYATKDQNKDHLPGGILRTKGSTDNIDEIEKGAVSDKKYRKQMVSGMSQQKQ